MVMLGGTGYIAKNRSRKTKRKLGIVCVKKAPRREKRENRKPALPISLHLTGICAVKRGTLAWKWQAGSDDGWYETSRERPRGRAVHGKESWQRSDESIRSPRDVLQQQSVMRAMQSTPSGRHPGSSGHGADVHRAEEVATQPPGLCQ